MCEIRAKGQMGKGQIGLKGKGAKGQKSKRAKGQKGKRAKGQGQIWNLNHRGKSGKALLSEIRRL